MSTCGAVHLWNATSMHHLTPLTGPRASNHKVLSSPLVVSTEETQRPHPAGRLAPRIRRPVILTRVPRLLWGNHVFYGKPVSALSEFPAAPKRLAGVQWSHQ